MKWRGKSSPARRVTGRPGKPHPEQDQIGGSWCPAFPRVGRMNLSVMGGLDRWSSSASGRIQNSAYRFTWPLPRLGFRLIKEVSALVFDQAFTHADRFVRTVSDSFIKFNRFYVSCTHLQIDFRASQGQKLFFDSLHHLPPQSLSLEVWFNREIVHPTPITFVTSHG